MLKRNPLTHRGQQLYLGCVLTVVRGVTSGQEALCTQLPRCLLCRDRSAFQAQVRLDCISVRIAVRRASCRGPELAGACPQLDTVGFSLIDLEEEVVL